MSSNQQSAGNISDRHSPLILMVVKLNDEGIECMNAAKFNEAFEKFDQAIALYPSPVFYCNRADVYGSCKQYDEAINDYRAAIHLDPNFDKAYCNMGLIFSLQDRYNEAIEAYKKAIELSPEKMKYQKGLDSAEEGFVDFKQRSSISKPEVIEKANALKEEGNQHLKASKFKESIDKYTQAIALNRDPIFLCNRAVAHCGLQQYNEALQDCTNAIFLDNNYAKAYGRMGFIMSGQGSHVLSAKLYKKALQLDPDNVYYKENLALAEAKIREADQQP